MKTCFRTFMVLSTVTTLLLAACTKDVGMMSTQQQIVGKWTIQTAVGHYVANGNDRSDTTYFTSADYIQFNGDGTLDIHEGVNTPSGKWKMDANNKLVISETNYMDYPAGFDISQLTSASLQLFYKETSAGTVMEQTLHLSR